MIGGPVLALGEGMIEIAGPSGAMTQRFGGDVMNTAVYLARLGTPVSFGTALGCDPFSDEMLAMLSAEGVGVNEVHRDPAKLPGLYLIRTDAHGERRFTYWRSDSAARAFFRGDDVGARVAAMLAGAGVLYLSAITLSLLTDKGRAALAGVASDFRASGGDVVLDTNYRPAGWPSREAAATAMQDFGAAATMALPTFDDDALLFGDKTPEDCAARWRGAGARIVAVKCGAEGVFVSSDDGDVMVAPDRVVAPVDTTGAGDSFNAAFLAALHRGETARAAAAHGNALAGRVIAHPGAIIPR